MIVAIALAIALVLSGLRIAQEYQRGVIFRLGRYTGLKGRNVGMHRFGASAPLKDLLKYFGFTVENVVAEARAAMSESRS